MSLKIRRILDSVKALEQLRSQVVK